MSLPVDQPLARIAGLTVVRGEAKTLAEVDLELRAEVVAVAGPNGAGKTTLLRVLATLLPASHGTVEIAGFDVSTPRGASGARSRIGFLPQDPRFLSTFTVEEAVAYAAWLHKIPRARRGEAVRQILEELDLASMANSKLGALSGGTRRRAYIGQALVHQPPVLLLDEATSGIDAEHRVDLRRFVRKIAAGRLVIHSTHLTEDVEFLSDRVVVLGGGRVQFDGAPNELARLGAQVADAAKERPIEAGLRLVSGWS